MNSTEFDEAILAAAGEHWRKVAMVVGRVADAHGVPIKEGEVRLRLIAERIEALVQDGRLEAQGDLKLWRHSEVRRP